MTRKRNSIDEDDVAPDVLAHIRSLELSTVKEYRLWCAANGFSRKLHKNWNQRCRERFHVQQETARLRMAQKKREQRNPLAVIRSVVNGQLHESEVTQPHLQRLWTVLYRKDGPRTERTVDKDALLRLLSHLHAQNVKFFDEANVVPELGNVAGNSYAEALALMSAYSGFWMRPVSQWKSRSHNSHRQFISLLRHLFVRHDDMPAFFDSVWFTGPGKENARQRSWFLHVGKGKNIRRCQLPLAFNKRMSHHFMHAPQDLTVNQALRWGQVHAMGGDFRLTRALLGTRLGESFENEDFWQTVIKWFIDHPMLAREHVGPIIDYLQQRRFEPEHIYLRPNGQELAPPAEPNLTMKGRNPETLLRSVNRWHQSLNSTNTHQLRDWQPTGIKPFELLEGSEKNDSLKLWTIRELLSSKALVAEGRKLKHCVATYTGPCASGKCSIWTMEIETANSSQRTKALTIEVDPKSRRICQARGKANRLPTAKELDIIRRWADFADLTVANYLDNQHDLAN